MALSIKTKIWLPAIALSIGLVLMSTGSAVRTVKSPAITVKEQSDQQSKLELASRWRGLVVARGGLLRATANGLGPRNDFQGGASRTPESQRESAGVSGSQRESAGVSRESAGGQGMKGSGSALPLWHMEQVMTASLVRGPK